MRFNRIAHRLQWTAIGFFFAGVAFTAGAILWTGSPDALVRASGIAVMAFGLPAAIAYAIAYWLDAHATPLDLAEYDDDLRATSATERSNDSDDRSHPDLSVS